MLDLKSVDIRSRLWSAIEASNQKLTRFRTNRTELIKEFVGSRYCGDEDHEVPHETIVNLMFQWVDIYSLALVPNRPQFLATPDSEELGSFAARYELATNNLVKEIGFEETLRQIVTDSFFGIGIAKTAMYSAGAVEIDDRYIDPGEPGCQCVSLDDAFWDVTAKRWRQIRFIGDRYEVQLESALSDESLDRSVVRQIQVRSLKTHDEKHGTQHASSIGRGMLQDDSDLTPMIQLYDVYLPQDQTVATLAWDQPDLPPLRVGPLDGPEMGPYRTLRFTDVPDNLFPVPPADNLYILHLFYNGLMRKIRSQALRQKTLLMYEDRAAGDVQKVVKTADGGSVRVSHIDAIRSLAMGGAEQTNVLMAAAVLEQFDRMGGNLAVMAGLGAQADTLGQEQMLAAQVGGREEKMAYHVHLFTQHLGNDLGSLLWRDRFKQYEQYLYTKAGRIPVPAHWTPDEREGNLEQFRIELDPYSMRFQSPSQRIMQLNNLLTNIYLPLLPVIQQQGGVFDVQALVETHAKLLAEPRIRQLIRFPQQPMNEIDQKSPPDPFPKPPVSTRNYNRHSASGPRRDGPMSALMSQISASGRDSRQVQPA